LACGGASIVPVVVSEAAWRKLIQHDLLTTTTTVAFVALIVVVVSGVSVRYRHW
jgi:hypothetical protein